MQIIREVFKCLAWLGVAVLLASCNRIDDKSVDCSTLGRGFYGASVKKLKSDFALMSAEKKYVAFICGNQTVHPPLIWLALQYAEEGSAATELLLKKLEETTSDVTVMNIMLVFSEMQSSNSYNVANDEKMMA